MKINHKITAITVITLWVIITLIRLAFHQPWYDEAHAYILAQNLTIPELIAEMKYEGHLLVWYLLIMPFAKLKLLYPYPMQIINWLCALISLLVIWKKAPFHPITKSIITFSYPFLAELPVVARCYSIGVMLLVIIASLYHKSLKHPIWYSILILLCANTSVIALFGATAFGIVFACELIKAALKDNISRKDFRVSFSILALGAVLVLWQIGGAFSYAVPKDGTFLINFSSFVFGNSTYNIHRTLFTKYYIEIAVYLILLCTPILFFIKDKKLFFINCFIFCGMMYCFMYKYPGYSQHYIFFWIYTMILYWLMIEKEGSKTRLMIFAEIVLLLFWGIQLVSKETKNTQVYHSNTKTTAYALKNIVEPDSRIIFASTSLEPVIPYLENEKLELYSIYRRIPKKMPLYAAYISDTLSDTKTNYIAMEYSGTEPSIVLRNNTLLTLNIVALLHDKYALCKVTKEQIDSEK